MSDHVAYSVDGAVATLRFDRPEKKNALTGAMYGALSDRLDEAGRTASVRVVVIAGSPGVFCAGNDIQDFVQAAMASDGLGAPVMRFLRTLNGFGKPLVAAVDGAAVGIGTTILLHCDYAVASERSVFATPFVDLGLVPEAGSSLLAPRRMGHLIAFELLVMGRRFDAARAREIGLLNAVAAPESVEAHAYAAAAEIAGKPPEALSLSRRLLKGDGAEVAARIEEEAKAFAQRLKSPEAAQAFMAFLSRKK